MHNHHVLGKRFCSKTNRIFLYFFTCPHCLNILICTFKCTGKSSSICMTAGDDNDERAFVKQPYVLHSIKFQNVCLCMRLLELSLELYILHEGTNIRCNRPEFPPSQFFPPGKEWAGPFFPRGKNRPAHSFPTQSVFSPPLIISKIIMELLFLCINLKCRY